MLRQIISSGLRNALVSGLVIASALLTFSNSSIAQSSSPNGELTVRFLANEGFLIQKGASKVLIDAFIKDAYYGYGALPDDDYSKLIEGTEPFNDIQLALTSHVHLDHFQTLPAVDFLKKQSQCEFISTEQVALKLRHAEGADNVQKQMVIVWPAEKEIRSVKSNGIRIDTFRIRHANPRNYEIQNLGVIVYLDGKTILHVGDAESRLTNFEWLKLPDKKIDLAILPYWIFNNRRLIEEHIAARHYIAAHIPVGQTAKIKEHLAENGIHVFQKPLERWKISR